MFLRFLFQNKLANMLIVKVLLDGSWLLQHVPELPDVGGPVDDGGDPGVLGECLGVHDQDVPVPPPHPGHRPGRVEERVSQTE